MAHMEITTRVGCKVACSYCPQDALTKAYKGQEEYVLSMDTFKACLAKIPKSVRIHFTGFAEPFLNSECAAMVCYAAKEGYKIEVSTTLVGMTPEDVKLMDPVKFELFNVHLPSKDSSEEVIPVDETYMSVIQALDESNIRLDYHCNGAQVHPKLAQGRDIRFVVPHDRAGNVKEKTQTKLKINRLKKAVRQFADEKSTKLKANGSQSEGEVKDLLKILDQKESTDPTKNNVHKTGHIRCSKDLRENVLLPNGDVVACCNDYGLEHSFGNLMEKDYQALFSSKGFKRLEDLMKDDEKDLLCRRDCKHARGVTLKSQLMDNKYVYNLRHIRRFSDVVYLAKRAKRKVERKIRSLG